MVTFKNYDTGGFYDELIDEKGHPRPGAQLLVDKIESLPEGDLTMRQKAAESLLLKMGITFNVYGREEGTEKIWPFDIIPRIVSKEDWKQIENGLKQRIFALNEFIGDIYNEKKILKDKIIPEELIFTCRAYRKECEGFTPPRGRMVSCGGHRSGSRQGWALLRSRRQPPVPVRRFLCSGEPPAFETDLSPGI